MNNEIIIWWNALDDFWQKTIINSFNNRKPFFQKKLYPVTKNDLDEICKSVYEISISKQKELCIPDLSFLKNLRKIGISHIEKIDYDNLKFNISLQEVELSNVAIRDLEFLSGNKNLKKLNLFSTFVQNLKPIKDCINLEELRFCEHYLDTEDRISDITPILNLENLRILHIGKHVISIESLKSLTKLEEFSYITMDSLNFLSNNFNLKKIFVMGNHSISHFDNLKGFEKLEKLEILDISYSNIKSLRELDNLKNLKKIIIKETPIDKEKKNYK